MKLPAIRKAAVLAIPVAASLILGSDLGADAQSSLRGRPSYADRVGAQPIDLDDPQPSFGAAAARTPQSGLPNSFFRAVIGAAARLNCNPRDLLLVIMRESSVRPDAWNRSSNAVGLIQFLPGTLSRLGWSGSSDQFRRLSAEEQVPWVERFLLPSSAYNLSSAGRIYLAIFMPVALRTAAGADSVLIDGRGVNADKYQRNRTLDVDGDGRITVGDLQRSIEIVQQSSKWRPIEEQLRNAQNGVESEPHGRQDNGEPEPYRARAGRKPAPYQGQDEREPEFPLESTIAPRVSRSREAAPRRAPIPSQLGVRVDSPLQVRGFRDFVRTVDLRTRQGMKEGLALLGFRSVSQNPWSALRDFQNTVRVRENGFTGARTRAALALALGEIGVRTLW